MHGEWYLVIACVVINTNCMAHHILFCFNMYCLSPRVNIHNGHTCVIFNLSVSQAYTTQKFVHSFRYFLPECVHHNPIVASSCIYAFQLFSGVGIQV